MLGLLFIFWTCPTSACPNTLFSAHSFYVEQSGSWLTLVLWLLQCSIRSIETFSCESNGFFPHSPSSVSGFHHLWESPAAHVVSWILPFLPCLKFQLYTGQYWQRVDALLPASGNSVISRWAVQGSGQCTAVRLTSAGWSWDCTGSYQELPNTSCWGDLCTPPTGILQIRDFLLIHINSYNPYNPIN